MVEQSSATPVQGSPVWRRMIAGRKTSSTNSHKATVVRIASDQTAWRFEDGIFRHGTRAAGRLYFRKKGRVSPAILAAVAISTGTYSIAFGNRLPVKADSANRHGTKPTPQATNA
jgi:hypothetical protein